jgi:hypothetical protein
MSSDDRTTDERGVVDIMRAGEETKVIKRLEWELAWNAEVIKLLE